MDRRLELDDILRTTLGSSNVYFQPPESVKLKYPCIIYERSNIRTLKADNLSYKQTVEYSIMVIDANPDSDIPFKVSLLPLTRYDRRYVANGLNHDVYTLFY